MENSATLNSDPALGALHVSPVVNVRRATEAEHARLTPWAQINGLVDRPLDVAEFADGQPFHAPEVIAAYHRLRAKLPDGFVLVYVHRGVQIDCIHPLIASLLHRTKHRGKSHAVRQHGPTDAAHVQRFVRAVTPPGGAAMVIDDTQIRVAPPGGITPAGVLVSTHFANQPSAEPTDGAYT